MRKGDLNPMRLIMYIKQESSMGHGVANTVSEAVNYGVGDVFESIVGDVSIGGGGSIVEQLTPWNDAAGFLGVSAHDLTGEVNPGDVQSAHWQNQQFQDQYLAGPSTYQATTGQAAYADPSSAATYQAQTGQYQAGQQFQDVLGQAMGYAQDFMSPTSDWAKGQQAILGEEAGQLAGQTQAQQSAHLASTGMGGGGLRAILGSQAQAQAGQTLRRGATDIATQGAGLGLQALGQAGQMTGQLESNQLQQAMANQAAMNQAAQFGAGAQNQFGMANLQNQQAMNIANMGALNQAAQFGAGQTQQANQFNASNMMNWDSWNASQDLASRQFNASQANAVMMGNTANQSGFMGNLVSSGVTAKIAFMCIPEGTKIDTPDGPTPIEELRAGDEVNGFGSKPTEVMQKHEYNENPDIDRFFKFTFDDGDTIDLCDMHRIKDKRSKDYNVGEAINGKKITKIESYDGVERSYDLLTKDKGYRISGVPVNSMIEEMNKLIGLDLRILKEVE